MEILGLPSHPMHSLSYLLPKHIQWSSLRCRVPSPQKLPEVIPPLCSPHTWLVLPPRFPSNTYQQGTRDAKSSYLSAKQTWANHRYHVMTFLVVGPMQVYSKLLSWDKVLEVMVLAILFCLNHHKEMLWGHSIQLLLKFVPFSHHLPKCEILAHTHTHTIRVCEMISYILD